LKDKIVLTTPEILAKISEAENATRLKRRKPAQNPAVGMMNEVENDVEDGIHRNEDEYALGIGGMGDVDS
jgi:hypothetical protein